MSRARNGGQAFPRAGFSGPVGFGAPENGMTLRDWFAGQALVGTAMTSLIAMAGGGLDPKDMEKSAAEGAYAMADAMLAERAKGGGA